MPRKGWTEKEVQLLCQMIEKGLSTVIIASKLNRTRKSIYFKIKRLGLENSKSVDNENKKFSELSSSIEPKELMTHEQVLRILSGAVQKLQESNLNSEETKRLKILGLLASRYDTLLERFERWDEIEKRILAIETRLEEVASQKQA